MGKIVKRWFKVGIDLEIRKKALLLCIVLLCFTSLFVNSWHFISPGVMPKWYFSVYPFALLLFLLSIFRIVQRNIKKLFFNLGFIRKVYLYFLTGCFLLALYGLLEYWHWLPVGNYFNKNAGFDNPAGLAACLSAGFPLVFYFFDRRRRWKKYAAFIIGIILIVGICFAKSRTGIFSLGVVGIVWMWQTKRIKAKKVWLIVCVIGALVLIGLLYLLNRQSADGRILVWICTLNMIAHKPLLGYGIGGFHKEYMHYQALFFKHHPHSVFANLAGNTHHAFNEYLYLMTNFGIAGFIVFLFLTYLLIKWYRKHRNSESDIAFLILVVIGSFSLFSYPFRYPFVWAMLVLAVLVILKDLKLNISVHLLWIKIGCACVIMLTLYGTYHFTRQMKAKMLWHQTTTLNLHKDQDSIYDNYAVLWPRLKNNYLFLYNVSALLNRMDNYKKSLQVAEWANKKCADYNLRLIIADDYFQMKKYSQALKNYTIAANMCPVRFFPLYRSFKIDKITKANEKADSLAQKIADKPVKVKSFAIKQMKKNTDDYLDRY